MELARKTAFDKIHEENELPPLCNDGINTNLPESRSAAPLRSLPLQGELEQYLRYLHDTKHLTNTFSNYVGAQIPGKFRAGGPISRPVHKTSQPLQHRSDQRNMSTVQEIQAAQNETYRLTTELKSMIN